jgi:hypothetical protein
MGAFLILAAACAGSTTSSGAAGAAPAPDSTGSVTGMQVVIDNQNFNDMNVYFVKAGSRILIGRAASMKTSTLTIPSAVTPADLRVALVAVPPGGSRPITAPSTIVPAGQRLYWTIGSDPSMSTVSTGE